MTTPDPLVLPSGGTVTFRDSAVHFKRGHHKRLAETIKSAEDGTVSFSTRSEAGWAVTDIMAEALVGSWRGPDSWYLLGRPVPGDDPSVMADMSSADLAALGAHLVPLAFEVLGLAPVTADGGDEDERGKGGARSGSTPISGSAPSTEPVTPVETLVDLETTLSDASPIS